MLLGMVLATTLPALADPVLANPVPADVARRELAPTGTLRVAINLGNPVLAPRAPNGDLGGVSVLLARALAAELDVPLTLNPFVGAGQVTDAVKLGGLDLVFLAIDPKRAEEIVFTPPYVLIEGTYMVRADSPLQAIADVDHPGVRVAVGHGSAYELFLSRALQHAVLVQEPTAEESFDLFRAGKADAAAGVREALEAEAQAHAGYRLIPGRFMGIEQAMGTMPGRPAGSAYLAAFIERQKASGFVAAGLAQTGQHGVRVAPAAGL